MKKICFAAVIALLFVAAPVHAQQVQNHAIPVGKGAGVTGFGAAVPGTSGKPLISTGASSDPAFGTVGNSGITPGAADTAKGTLDGVSTTDLSLPSCTASNQAWKYASGVGINCSNVTATSGFDTPVNLGLSASAAANALTINITQASGSAPSSSNPVVVPFRSLTGTSGVVTYESVTSALSITIPTSATLGTSNSVPFRIWIFLTAGGGTPAIGVATCSSSTAVYPCASWEYTLKTTIAISAGSTSGGVLYVASGVSADAVRIVGYCDYGSGLATAGTWASSCTALQVFGPGIKKPGDVVQDVYNRTGAVDSTATAMPGDDTIPQITEGKQFMAQAVVPTASANLLEVETQIVLQNNGGAGTLIAAALFRDATTDALVASFSTAQTANASAALTLKFITPASSSSSTTFSVRAGGGAGTTTFNGAGAARLYGGVLDSYVRIREIMGFDAREPANDNVNPGVFSATG